jgi:hypothetical protein
MNMNKAVKLDVPIDTTKADKEEEYEYWRNRK